jgi:hypothetical protein
MATTQVLELRVLLYVQNDTWIAQCIDFDIASQAESPKQVIESFERVFAAQLLYDQHKGKQPLEGIAPAPQHFFEAFEKGLPLRESYPLDVDDVVRVSAQEFRLAA